MSQIVSQPINEEWSEFDLSDDRVAASAEESTNAPGFVAVVDDERSFIGIAQQAATILDFSHGVDLSRCESVFPLQSRAQVLVLAWLRDIAADLDQPCHADVLLELANA